MGETAEDLPVQRVEGVGNPFRPGGRRVVIGSKGKNDIIMVGDTVEENATGAIGIVQRIDIWGDETLVRVRWKNEGRLPDGYTTVVPSAITRVAQSDE